MSHLTSTPESLHSHPEQSTSYLGIAVLVLWTNLGQCLLWLTALLVAAHSAKIITSDTSTPIVAMDNDPQPVQSQKKEKSLNELLTSTIVDIYIGPESTHWPLHERLLCYQSPFLARVFYDDHDKNSNNNDTPKKSSSSKRKSYGLPDEEDRTFTLLVGWLYSRVVPPPKIEKDVGPLLDLYLLAEKLEMAKLSNDVVTAVREYYYVSSTYPGLRRVQYVYANTDEDNEMREMMVSSVARQLTTIEKIPAHWASALQRNGQLAVDIIRSIQKWNIEEKSIPDIRDGSVSSGRGRKSKGGFSAIEREGDSMETDATGITGGSLSLGSNLGVESVTSDDPSHADDKAGQEFRSASRAIAGEANYDVPSTLSLKQAQLKRPPDLLRAGEATIARFLDTFDETKDQEGDVKLNLDPDIPTSLLYVIEADNDQSEEYETEHFVAEEKLFGKTTHVVFQRWEMIFLLLLWLGYLWYIATWWCLRSNRIDTWNQATMLR